MIETTALAALNHLLTQAAWARERLQPHAGKCARLVATPWSLCFVVSTDGRLETATAQDADVTITLPADTPWLALQGLDKLMATAHVAGNAEFATALSFVFKNLRWDYEEDLSRWIGDIAAHRVATGIRAADAWRRDAGERLRENIAEYAIEENPLLVRAQDFAVHRDEIAAFAASLSRLEARVAKLSS